MKRRLTKQRVQREENNLTACVQQAISDTDDDAMTISARHASSLGSDLTYLLSERLRLEPSWSHKKHWLDGIEWDSLMAVSTNEIRGEGKIWWGNVNDLAGPQTREPFEAEVGVETGNTFDSAIRLNSR